MKEPITLRGRDWEALGDGALAARALAELEAEAGLRAEHPWNLGVCAGGGRLRASSYVGCMPLLRRDGTTLRDAEGRSYLLRIEPRFGAQATELLRRVMEDGNQPLDGALFQVRDLTVKDLRGEGRPLEQEKLLFGRVADTEPMRLKARRQEAEGESGFPVLPLLEVMDFLKRANSLLSKSILHSMERTEENLNGRIRGKILVPKQLRLNVARGQPQRVWCTYNTLSANNRENRILRWTLHLCQNFLEEYGLERALGEALPNCGRALGEVPLVRCTLQDFMGLKTNGAYREYRDALRSAQRIIGKYALAFGEERGPKPEPPDARLTAETDVPWLIEPWLINMDLLFELYCRTVLRRALEKAGGGLRLEKKRDIPLLPERDRAAAVFMQTYTPDMVIVDGAGRPVAVLDAKNSPLLEQSREKRRERTHQVLFYMTALGCPCGGLVGWSREGGTQDFPLLVNGEDPGAAGPRLGALLLSGAQSYEEHVAAMGDFLRRLKLRMETEAV